MGRARKIDRFLREMQDDSKGLQHLTVEEAPAQVRPGVFFDPEEATLEGTYLDELSAFRAKRVWTETLETNFLLQPTLDFSFKVESDVESRKFVLRCDFSTACGRYAFWRLTRNQAPEAQYLIETAHIPQCESRHEDMLVAPDLKPVRYSPLVLGERDGVSSIRKAVIRLLRRMGVQL